MVSPPFEVKSQLENVPEGKLKPYFAGLIGWVHRQISTADNTSSRAQRRTYKLHGGPGMVRGGVWTPSPSSTTTKTVADAGTGARLTSHAGVTSAPVHLDMRPAWDGV